MSSPRSSQNYVYGGFDDVPLYPDYVQAYASHHSPRMASSIIHGDDLADESKQPQSTAFINYLFERRGWVHRPPPTTSSMSYDGEETVVCTADVFADLKEAEHQTLFNTGTTATPTSSSMPGGSGSVSSAVQASPQVQLSSVPLMPNMQAPLKGSFASSESASLTSQQSTAVPPPYTLRSSGSSTQDWPRQPSCQTRSGDSTPTLPPSICAAPANTATGQQHARRTAVASPGSVVAGRAWPLGPSGMPPTPTVVHCAGGYVNGRLSCSSLGSISGVSTGNSVSSPAPTRMLRTASAAYVRPTAQARPVQTGSCRNSPGPDLQSLVGASSVPYSSSGASPPHRSWSRELPPF